MRERNENVSYVRTNWDPLTDKVIGAAIAVHRELGPGLLESAYEECLAYELRECGLDVRRQVICH